jgi:hypothetical protein
MTYAQATSYSELLKELVRKCGDLEIAESKIYDLERVRDEQCGTIRSLIVQRDSYHAQLCGRDWRINRWFWVLVGMLVALAGWSVVEGWN